jgi:hypothetical protein
MFLLAALGQKYCPWSFDTPTQSGGNISAKTVKIKAKPEKIRIKICKYVASQAKNIKYTGNKHVVTVIMFMNV